MKVVRINAGEFGSNCWLIIDDETKKAVIIDPSAQTEVIEKALKSREVSSLEYILLTHSHFDHMTSCDSLRDLTAAPLCVHKDDAIGLYNSEYNAYRIFMAGDIVYRPAETELTESSILNCGNLQISLLHTPGHTKGSVCYIIKDKKSNEKAAMFTGDTIFDGGIGRCDLKGADMAQMISSLKKIKSLEDDFLIFTGHGSNTTLEKQKQYNVYLKNI